MAYIGQAPANKPVEGSDISSTVITGQTALATAPEDTDEFLISDAGTLKRIDASLVVGGGKINQVVQTVKTDIFTSTTASLTDVTGFSVSITPTATSSKVLVMAQYNLGVSSGYKMYSSLLRGSTEIYKGDAAGSRVRVSFGSKANANDDVRAVSHIFLDSPNTTSATTYKIQVNHQNGTYRLNSRDGQWDGASTIMIMEVAA